MSTLSDVENFLETVAIDALDAAGYAEVAAFIPLLNKFVVMVEGIAAKKKIDWDPSAAVLAAELGAMATLDVELPEKK